MQHLILDLEIINFISGLEIPGAILHYNSISK